MAHPQHDNTAARVSADASGEAIHAIRTLVDARDIRAAKQQLRRARTDLDDSTWTIIGEIANTLRHKTHDVALTKLRKLWRDNEQHRALIEACAPKTDQHQYIPETQPTTTRRTDPPWRPAGPVERRVEPAKRTDPRKRTGSSGAARVDIYEDQLTPEERKEPGTPRAELIVDRRDYDRDAAAKLTETLCVSCRVERAVIDRWTGQITTGHGDDGLCGTCRDEGRPGIPELPLGHSRSQAIRARLDTIATNFDSHNPELFRLEWRYGDHLTRSVTAAWVKQHTPNRVVRQTATTKSDDLNGECIECGDWRQLRDELCVDCHNGLNGEVVPAGALGPLTTKGSFGRVIDKDAMVDERTSSPTVGTAANSASYQDELMHRLEAGQTKDRAPTTAAPSSTNTGVNSSRSPASRRRQQNRNQAATAALASRVRRM
ncbi:hypothetical protein [Nocardia colli]|uniref:hypothetical protein n=1 Tax=Nocardia colli TaxID=2545717 RepID=UPI0035D91FEC